MRNLLNRIDPDIVKQLLNVGASFAAIMVAADAMEKAGFGDDEVEAISWLPEEVRAETVSRLIDAAEAIHEELRELDGRLLILAPPAW